MSGRSEDEDRALEARAKALFDESVDGLDARTRARLAQARRAVVDELGREPAWKRRARMLWAPAAGAVVAAVAAMYIALHPGAQLVAPEDLDLVASSEELELLQDVDFYAWLAHQPQSAGADGGFM